MSWKIRLNSSAGYMEYSLDNLADVGMADFDGVGMAPVEYFVESGAQQNGATLRNYRLRPRTITLVVWAVAQTLSAYWAQREQLLRIFRPGLPIVLTKTLPGGATRSIDCYFGEGMTLGSQERKNWTQRVGFTLYCPSPLWYAELSNVALVDTWTVGVRAAKDLNFYYAGSADEYPVIILYPERTILGVGLGSIVDPVITDYLTGEKLDLTGYTIAPGHVVEFDCRYGYKTVVDYAAATPNVRTNIIRYLSTDSDLTTFHLTANIVGQSSQLNRLTLTATATSGTEATLDLLLNISKYDKYLGV